MEFIKWYFFIGTVIAVLFELILWFLKDDLDKKTKQYFSKHGVLIYIVTWPYLFYIIIFKNIK